MQIFLINLARRPDRLAAMTRMTDNLGLALTRVPAVDATLADPESVVNLFSGYGPLGEISWGDRCCGLSHAEAWKMFLRTGKPYAVVLEDDVRLAPEAWALLNSDAWIPAGVNLVKLEHYGPETQRVLLSDMREVRDGFAMGRMLSRHTGAAAYIVSRAAAQQLLKMTEFPLSVDHLLFNPNNSPIFETLSPWQMVPAIARQQNFVGEKSNIDEWRVSQRKFSFAYVKRELVRFGYELRLLPQQLAAALSGRAKFVEIGSELPLRSSAGKIADGQRGEVPSLAQALSGR